MDGNYAGGPGPSPSAGSGAGSKAAAAAATGGAQRSGAGDDAAADGEQDDSSSSSLLPLLEQRQQKQETQPSSECLSSDLARFREQWREEVTRPKTGSGQATPVKNNTNQQNQTTILDEAVSLYLRGMELEQQGELYEAIQKYRRAVQCDPAVEQAIRQLLVNRQQQQQQPGNGNNAHDGPADVSSGEEDEGCGSGEDRQVDGLLTRLQRLVLEQGRFCLPATPQTMAHISCLPSEVLQLILRWVVSSELDVRSLEQVALVSRGLYTLCRDPAIWKLICRHALGVGCAGAGCDLQPVDWRHLYVTRQHLHFSGCYISRASYIRCGDTFGYQDASYRPWHMVVYYRFLRFFPEGRVLMLTSAEEPAVTVQHLRHRTGRHPHLMAGHYRIKGDRVVVALRKPREAASAAVTSNNKSRARRRAERLCYDPGEQTLHLELDMRAHRGRCGYQLVWQGYTISTLYRNGREASSQVALNDQFPPLTFSRVRSYTASSEAPLA